MVFAKQAPPLGTAGNRINQRESVKLGTKLNLIYFGPKHPIPKTLLTQSHFGSGLQGRISCVTIKVYECR